MPSKKSAANQALGKTIRAVRRKQGYTQESFALKADIDRSYYGAIERGEFNVTVDTRRCWAALGCRRSEPV